MSYSLGWPEPYIVRYIRCTYGIFGREITMHTVIYGADIRLWPTLPKVAILNALCLAVLGTIQWSVPEPACISFAL